MAIACKTGSLINYGYKKGCKSRSAQFITKVPKMPELLKLVELPKIAKIAKNCPNYRSPLFYGRFVTNKKAQPAIDYQSDGM